MTREEAVKIIKSAMDYMPKKMETLKTLIPELRESEDERIRKELLEYLTVTRQRDFVARPERQRWIAYLERQKEHSMSAEEVLTKAGLKPYKDGNQWCILAGDNIQEGICGFGDTIDEALYQFLMEVLEKQKENPKSADSIPSDCASDAKCEDRWHKVTDSLPDNPREVLCKDAIGNFFIGRYYKSTQSWEVVMYDDCDKDNEDNPPVVKWCEIPSEKQEEQKPWKVGANAYFTPEQKPAEWSPTKGQMVALNWAANGMLDNDSPSAGDIKANLRSLYNDLQSKSIRPAEWSDKDDATHTRVLGALGKAFMGVLPTKPSQEDIEWFKSLPKRFNLQPKQEWSEEDEEMLNSIIATCQLAAQDRDSEPARHLLEMQERFLKSLRPSWKPSEEQMDEFKIWLTKQFNLAKKCMKSADRDWNRAYENGEMEAYANVLVHIGETPDRSQKEHEQPEVDLKKEIKEWTDVMVGASFPEQDGDFISEEDYRSVIRQTAIHFLGLNAKKEE